MTFFKAILHYTALYMADSNGHEDAAKYLGEVNFNYTEDVIHKSKEFIEAAQRGDVAVIKYFMEQNDFNSEIKTPEIKGNTYISILNSKLEFGSEDIFNQFLNATKVGNINKLKQMLNAGADINSADSIGCTALHYAALNNYKEIVGYLLENNANVHVINIAKDNPIHCAARNGHFKIIQILIEYGIDINVCGENLNTSLHFAVQHGSPFAVKNLVKLGAKCVRNRFGYLPIHYTTTKESFNKLLKLGLHHHYKDELGNTPLHIAAKNGHTKMLEDLLQCHRILINTKNSNGSTPLHVAAEHGNKEIIRILIKEGANTEELNKSGHSVLHQSIDNHQESMAMFLLELGCDIKNKTQNNTTVLHLSAQIGSQKLVLYSLNSGLKINEKNKLKYSPLIYASLNGHVKVGEILLERKAYINEADRKKSTALHHAVQGGHVDFVTLLIKHGAKIRSNNRGKSPIDIASEKGFWEIKLLLENHKLYVC